MRWKHSCLGDKRERPQQSKKCFRGTKRFVRSKYQLLCLKEETHFHQISQNMALELVVQVLGAINILSNGYCCYYSYKTFNIKLCLNFIMFFDAALTSLASFFVLLSSVLHENDPLICSFATFSFWLVPELFCPFNFMLAYIR